tara:strand:- start:211 stop:429 length:219 start_codon:yes stop_codon:yes gene_type:complete
MEETLVEVVKQVPALVVLAWLIKSFVSYIRSRDQATKHQHSSLITTVEKNTIVLAEVSMLLRKLNGGRDVAK